MGEALHGWQGDARRASRCAMLEMVGYATACTKRKQVPGYFCLGGALRGYILSITSVGTPRIRCNCLFVAE